jgi:hypothetical protein
MHDPSRHRSQIAATGSLEPDPQESADRAENHQAYTSRQADGSVYQSVGWSPWTVEINSRLRAKPGLQRAFGRTSCAEQSVVQETLSACTEENVLQLHQALDEIYRAQSQGFHHDYQAAFQLLDVDLTGMPCGPKAAFATRGYFAGLYHRRGRQLGRVLATQYEEVMVDQLFAGNVQLIKALQPLVEAAETTLQLDDAKRRRTSIRVDAGAGTEDDLNWLLSRGYEVMAKEYSGRRITRLSQTVKEWVQDPTWSERSFG